MDRIKPDESRRRTVVSKKSPNDVPRKESKSSIASFFFGGKPVSQASGGTTQALSKAEGGSMSSKKGLVRVNSSASLLSAVSKDSDTSNKSSIKGSAVGSIKSATIGSQVSTSARSHNVTVIDEEDVLENKTVEISMKLRLWETTGTSKAKDKVQKHKRSLHRDNSTGSNKSNLSNMSTMSALTSNSNISILSRSSSGSLMPAAQPNQPSSARAPKATLLTSAPFDPAAAAAQSRRRYYGDTASAPEEPPKSVRVISAVQPIIILEKSQVNSSSSQVPKHHSPSAAASLALTAPSSNESTPQSSPKLRSRKSVELAIHTSSAEMAEEETEKAVAITAQLAPEVSPIIETEVMTEEVPEAVTEVVAEVPGNAERNVDVREQKIESEMGELGEQSEVREVFDVREFLEAFEVSGENKESEWREVSKKLEPSVKMEEVVSKSSLPLPAPLSIPATNPTPASALSLKPALKSPHRHTQQHQHQDSQPVQETHSSSLVAQEILINQINNQHQSNNLSKQGMEALPNRSAEMLSARLNWVRGMTGAQRAAAGACKEVSPVKPVKPVTPRSVQFSASTKSMASVGSVSDLTVESQHTEIGKGVLKVEGSSSSGEGESVSEGEDLLLIEGATLVDEVEIEVEVEDVHPLPVLVESACVLQEKENERKLENKEVSPIESGRVASLSGAIAPAIPADVILRHVGVDSSHNTDSHHATLLPLPALHHIVIEDLQQQKQTQDAHHSTLLPLPTLNHVDVVPRDSSAHTPKAEFLAIKLKHTNPPLTSNVTETSIKLTTPSDYHPPFSHSPSDSPAQVSSTLSKTPRASLSDPRLSLQELVHRNTTKQYDGLCQQQLEAYLSEEEFLRTFRMRRESFYALSQWRQQNQKRSVGLF